MTETRLYKGDLFELAERAPAVRLRRYVTRYTAWLDRRTTGLVERRHLPSGLIPLIINFDADVRIRRGGSGEWCRHRAFTAGLHDVFTTSESSGRNLGVQIDLTALGARLLYDRPLGEFANRIVDFGDLSASFDTLSSMLFDAPTWNARFDVLDREIAARAAAVKRLDPRLERAWDGLSRSGGRSRIEAIRRDIGWSERHFATRFRHEFGLTPKTFAGVLRFARAARMLSDGRGGPRADVALACGYFDQAHFNRDFRKYSGMTPTAAMART